MIDGPIQKVNGPLDEMGNRVTFTVVYDGDEHSMDVRDLAPALIAFGDLVGELNQIENGKSAQTSIRFRATKSGSFRVDLELVQGLLQQLQSIVTPIKDASELLVMLVGLFVLLRKLRGRKPDRASVVGDAATIEIDGATYTFPLSVIRAAESVSVRSAAQTALGPLKSEAVKEVRIEYAQNTELLATKSDVDPMFEVPAAAEEKIIDAERLAALTVVAPNFRDGNKWRFSDGGSDLWATLGDAKFLADVADHRVTFAKGDVLMCRVRYVQWQTPAGLRSENTVIEVQGMRRAMRQMSLLDD